MKSTTTPLAIHIMRIFLFSSSSWFVIDPSFFGIKTGIIAGALDYHGRKPPGGTRCGPAPARLKHGAEALSATVSHALSGVEQTFRKICRL
jgi:hypothetical protein